MAQRLWVELDRLNHQVVVTYPNDNLVAQTQAISPELIIAPFLTSKIPKAIWTNYVCLIVHPGIRGDRGASSLDWAILRKHKTWGTTILQAVEKMDAGPIWASIDFQMRDVAKGELYRNEVTQAAAKGILQAVENFAKNDFKPMPLDYSNPEIKGSWNNKTKQKDFSFSWEDEILDILRKLRAADSAPGVLIELDGQKFYAYGAHEEGQIKGNAGGIVAQRDDAICVVTKKGAIWLTHLKADYPDSIKLPAMYVLAQKKIPIVAISPFESIDYPTWREIRFEQEGEIGYLYFDFYNGAMSTHQCNRLREAIIEAKKKVRMLVLMGGRDVWSNGIHLNVIEAAKNPAQESWENIQAIDDLILEIINSTEHYVVAALQGNAGAGGVSIALATDKVMARKGIVLNPHTKNMGLYGSEYWTYLLPKRIGYKKALRFTEDCLPWGVEVAYELKLIDDFFGESNAAFVAEVKRKAQEIYELTYFDKLIRAKKFQRKKDERDKPLAKYREEELARMHKNFFEDDWAYAYKRFCFVHKIPEPSTQMAQDLYRTRREIYRKRKWERLNYD